jgi:hypothetical protein
VGVPSTQLPIEKPGKIGKEGPAIYPLNQNQPYTAEQRRMD